MENNEVLFIFGFGRILEKYSNQVDICCNEYDVINLIYQENKKIPDQSDKSGWVNDIEEQIEKLTSMKTELFGVDKCLECFGYNTNVIKEEFDKLNIKIANLIDSFETQKTLFKYMLKKEGK